MSWAAGAIYSTGDIVTAAAWNIGSDNFLVLENRVGLLDTGQSADMTTPPATTAPNFYKECGVVAVATSSAGQFTVTFPTTFPNGLSAVVVCPGDNDLATEVFELFRSDCTVSGFSGHAYYWNATVPAMVSMNSATCTIAYEATGY